MAVDLDAEVKRRKIADSLTNGDDESDATDTTDTGDEAETTDSDTEEKTEEPSVASARQEPSPVQTLSDYSAAPAPVASPTPAQPVTYPTIAEDQTGAPSEVAPTTTPVPEGHIDLGPPGRNIYTDPETGGRYIIDPEAGKIVPHAELATAADKAAQSPEGVVLPQVDVTPAPNELAALQQESQYEGGLGLPGHPTMVPRAKLVERVEEEGLPVTPTPPKIERGQLVSVLPGTAPRALSPTKTQLPNAPLQPGPATQLPAGPIQPGARIQLPNAPVTQPAPVQRTFGPVQTLDDYSAPKPAVAQQQVAQQPVTGELAKGPPGTRPAGTEDEPYWPKSAEQIGQLPAGVSYIDPRDGSQKTTPGTATQQRPAAQPAVSATNPNGSDFPAAVPAVGNKEPAAFIVHHTSGRGTVNGVVSTLNERGLGVEYVMDRDGNIFQTGGPGAQNILAGWGPKGTGLNNQNVVGMEIIAKDDKDVTPAQAKSFANFIAARYPNTPLYGHGEVNPGHKEADEGLTAKNAALALRAGGQPAEAAAPSAQPVTKLKNGFYQDEKPGDFITGKATTFATPDDIASGQDNGRGAPKLGNVDTTQVAGLAIPQSALEQMFGRDWAAAARQARVDVVDQATGKRLRVPIVDLGPRGDLSAITDQTPALANLFGGGDRNLSIKIVPNAGPDVTKNPQLFYDEQAAIRNGFDSSTLDSKRQVIGPQFQTRVQTPEEAAAAQKTVQTAIQKQQDLVSKLPEADSGNVIGLYKRLDDPVDGMTSQSRQAVQANLKPQIIAAMREKFPDLKSDADAWTKAQSDVGPLEVGAEAWSQLLGGFQQYTSVLQKGVAGTDQLHVNQFLDQVMPGATDQAKQDYLAKLYGMPIDQRIAEIQSRLPQPQAGIPSTDPQQIVSALDRAHNTDYQKQQAADLVTAQADMKRNLTTDPRLIGTGVGKIVDNVAQIPAFVAAYSNPVMLPMVLAQTNDMARTQLKQDHPDWDEKTIGENAARATVVMFLGQEAGAKLMGSGGGALLNALEGKGKRAIAQALLGFGGGAAISGATQAGVNVATGAPVGRGLGEAAIAGAIQGGATGIVHGGGELARPGERPVAVVPEVQPAPSTEPIAPPPRPVTQAEVTGPEISEPHPWYKPPPIVTRGEERTTFTPAELAEQAGTLKGGTPEELQAAAQKLVPPMDFGQRGVWLNSDEAQQAEIDKAQAAQAPQSTQEQQAAVERTNVVRGATGDAHVGAEDPWVSKIANRFTAERMATGELGYVEPGIGVSKEEMLASGLKMGPEAVNQHISNLMNNVGGDPKLQAAAVRAEEARLAQRSRDLSLVSEANPQNSQARIDADNAFKDLSDFHNGPVAKLKNDWHATGMTLQGEIPTDLSTYNGLREQFLKDVGKPPDPKMEPVLRATAKRVRNASAAETAAMNKLGAEIERQSARRRLPTDEQVRENIMTRMKVEPCPT